MKNYTVRFNLQDVITTGDLEIAKVVFAGIKMGALAGDSTQWQVEIIDLENGNAVEQFIYV